MLFNIIIPLGAFLLCTVIAHLLSKTSLFLFLDKREKRFASLDGMRGFLALSVFIHHFVVTYYWQLNGVWKRPPDDLFQNYGKVGVAVFFMITGFLFITKITQDNKKINWLLLYQSRFFRIVPLYVFTLGLISFLVFSHSSYQINIPFHTLMKQYINWGIFMGGAINDFSNANLIIAGVDWTLKYEWLFYLSLPFIAIFLKTFKKIGALAIILMSLLVFFKPLFIMSFYSPFIIFFCIGGLASYIVKNYKSSIDVTAKKYSIINMVLIIIAMFYPKTLDFFHVCIISLFFLLTLLGNNLFGIFSSRASAILGEISYSIYLLHGMVLYVTFSFYQPINFVEYSFSEFLFFMPLISMLVVLISIMSFLCIEKPFMRIGRKINTK